ncbi:hypothetical protein CYMTET_42204 [Cymbomonas tetramitiformis]|uniref:EGF-like domain-containing protein n=1 Tax=Cymbomonas tetramitiformis TaxID=36881 RepID=A0AAE0C5V9_9CHLO|nr:hypothetical protein CYMTET_42204 [Cymbomonas tetramitiformis]
MSMTFFEEDVSGGASPDDFLSAGMSRPGHLFVGSSNTLLSTATVTSSGWMASGAISISLPSLPSPPPNPPPGPPPCSADPCFPGVECENVLLSDEDEPGGLQDSGFHCLGCPDGYEGDGVTCSDLDECAVVPNGGCDNATTCINLLEGQGRSCTACPEGMTGTGETVCLDDNECLVNNGGCDFRTECINTAPGYHCGPCPDGYLTKEDPTTSAKVCADVDECAADNGGCDVLTRCTNTDGGKGCGPCPSDYSGDGYTGCWKASDCSQDPCDPLTTCDNSSGVVQCGACPAGYDGTGDTKCVDIDACEARKCFDDGDPAHKVECFDVEAPGAGYSCAACPYAYVGDGITCVEDKCITGTACSPLVTCSMLTSGQFACGFCPEGFYGDGRVHGIGTGCTDLDECATLNGNCHHLTACTNTYGGHVCGPCPEGYLGSGETSCNLKTDCSVNNGGPAECRLVVCRDVPAPGVGYRCDACPVGYLGDGEGKNSTVVGKVGCYENFCFNDNGGCSIKVDCVNNPDAPGGRVCGDCPQGYTNKYLDGTVCEDENGCVVDPCFQGVECEDLVAPLVGRKCGPCPAGYEGDGATCRDVDECAEDADPTFGGCFRDSSIGVVTECTNVKRSVDAPRGRTCGACPEGYKGSGETGCTLVTTCAMSNGGCWVGSGKHSRFNTTCTDIPGVGTECGECPPGFSGSGDTGCIDIDGCVLEPCFPGVRCTDVAAPEEGRLCDYVGPVATVPWGCPEGYHGDGVDCTQCRVSVQIVDSTVQDGVEQRAGWFKGQRTQLTGHLADLSHPNCTNQQGTVFVWEGVASDESILNLTAARNKAKTLKLSIPKLDLVVGLNYQLSLTAYMPGAPVVRDASILSFFVKSQPLVVVIKGGAMVTGSGNRLRLSAEDSVDPDGEPGEIYYVWSCARTDTVASTCVQADGAALPSKLTNVSISFTLLGGPGGANYTFLLAATKGSRRTKASTWLNIFDGESPMVTITPMVDKASPSAKITLSSIVESDSPETLGMQWSCEELALDSAMLMTSLKQEDLVLRPGVLTPGLSYTFQLRATDRIGVGSAVLEVEVNTPPYGGAILVSPLEGVELDTEFSIQSPGWVDTDAPMWYQQAYYVTGSGAATWSSLVSDFGTLPSPYRIFTVLPKAGLEARHHQVQVRVTVMDALGASATAETNVTVREAEEVDTAALLGSAADRLRNGDTDGTARYIAGLSEKLNEAAHQRDAEAAGAAWRYNSTDGYHYYSNISSSNSSTATFAALTPPPAARRRLLSAGGDQVPVMRRRLFMAPAVVPARRRRRLLTAEGEEDDGTAAAAQRESLLGMVGDMQGMLYTTTASTAALAASVGEVVGAPCELSNETQAGAIGMMDGLIAGSRDGGEEASMSLDGATQMAGALSSLNEAGQVGVCSPAATGNASSDAEAENADLAREAAANRTTEVQRQMAALGETLLAGAVDGEDAQQVASATLALTVQRSRSDLADSSLYTQPLAAPGGEGASSASFPPSLGTVLAGGHGRRRGLLSEGSANCTAGSANCTSKAAEVALPRKSVDARLIASATEAHFVYVEDPAWTNRSDSDSDGCGGSGDNGAVDSDLPAEANRTDASGSTSVVLLGADGQELNVSGLSEGVVVEIELSEEVAGRAVVEVEKQTGLPWVGYVDCRFWDEAGQRYSSEGCVPLPNPAPLGADLYWRSRNVEEVEAMEMLWGVGNDDLLAGCEEVWEAAVPEFNGTDAGLRKYGNYSLSEDGNFTAAVPSDFKAENLQEQMRREPPTVRAASMNQMTSLTLDDLLASALLLAIVGGMMGGALYFAVCRLAPSHSPQPSLLCGMPVWLEQHLIIA